jgi:hypothetical protein
MNGSASRPESSVLFSLRELRDIEHRRVADEREAAKAAQEARERACAAEVARVAAERAAADEAEKNRKEGELAARKRQLEQDAIRIQETEARMRAEALVKLEAERLAYEVELRREEIARKRPRWLMGVAAACAAVAIGVGFLAMKASDNAEQSKAAVLDAEAKAQAARDAITAQEERIAGLENDIKNAKSEIEKKNLEILKKQEEADYIRKNGKKPPTKKPGNGGGTSTSTSGNGSGSGSGSARGEITVRPDEVL